MISDFLYRQGGHGWMVFGQDPSRPDNIIDTNQFVIRAGGEAMLLDPGGTEIFPAMLGALIDRVPIDEVAHIFLSHQDPDIGSSLPLWREVCRGDVTIHISGLWTSFISHFDAEARITPIPDRGATVRLGGPAGSGTGVELTLLPAHFLHSPANFHVYDPAARILFSADVGASLLDGAERKGWFVTDFAEHVRFMEGWHRRAMGSERARDAWVERVSRLDVEILAPQHGLLLRGDDVRRFLDWFSRLPLGLGIEEIAG